MKSKNRIPAAIRLISGMVESITKDADKGMFLITLLNGEHLVIPCTMRLGDMHALITKTNEAYGIEIPILPPRKNIPAPTQLDFFGKDVWYVPAVRA